MKTSFARFVLVCLVGLLPGCASIVSSSNSTTYIETDPEKARCELHGQDFKRVVQTPNTLHLPAKAAPIKIHCTATGYHDAKSAMDTSADGSIAGNILFGGVIGLAIDAATQSGMKFPERITIVLDPKGFVTTADRDAWYQRRQRLVQRESIDKFMNTSASIDCDTSSDTTKRKCFEAFADSGLKGGRNDALADLKGKYETAEIDPKFGVKSEPTPQAPKAKVAKETHGTEGAPLKKSDAEIKKYWQSKIDNVKADGPYKDCDIAVDNPSIDPAGFADCEERGHRIKRFQNEMKRELAS